MEKWKPYVPFAIEKAGVDDVFVSRLVKVALKESREKIVAWSEHLYTQELPADLCKRMEEVLSNRLAEIDDALAVIEGEVKDDGTKR